MTNKELREKIDEMVRDFTTVVPRPKSEVRRRINALLTTAIREARVETIGRLSPFTEHERICAAHPDNDAGKCTCGLDAIIFSNQPKT